MWIIIYLNLIRTSQDYIYRLWKYEVLSVKKSKSKLEREMILAKHFAKRGTRQFTVSDINQDHVLSSNPFFEKNICEQKH